MGKLIKLTLDRESPSVQKFYSTGYSIIFGRNFIKRKKLMAEKKILKKSVANILFVQKVVLVRLTKKNMIMKI